MLTSFILRFYSSSTNTHILSLAIILVMATQLQGQGTCPQMEGPVFKKVDDIIITTYHSHIAKTTTGYVTWGEDMASNGGDATAMTAINSANGYNYTGDIIMFCISGNAGAQAFLLTTTGMYSWGLTTEVVGGSIVSSNSFSSMTMPSGVTPSDVLEMKASTDIFYLVTNNGNVWVAGQIATQVSGNASNGANTWHQVQTSAGVPLTGVIEITGTREAAYALKDDGTLVGWGRGITLGGGAAATNETYATIVNVSNLPAGVTLSQPSTYMDNSANSSGLLALGSDGKVYGMGYSGVQKILNNATAFINDWMTIKDSNGDDMENIVFLTTSENSEEYAGAAIIQTVTNSTNLLYTWGYAGSGAIGHSGTFVEYPSIPSGFTSASDNPVFAWVGGHAASYLNDAGDGSICFTGHITNGSGGGLQTDQTKFTCFDANHPNWPAGVLLCNQIPCALTDPGTLTGACANEADLTFTLNLTGTGVGAAYNITGDLTASNNLYSTNNTFTITNGADGTNKTITVTDLNDSGCTLSITITGAAACPNFNPIAVNDIDTTLYQRDTFHLVLQNDSDDNGDDLSITGVGTNALNGLTANGGTVSINDNGTPSNTTDDYINYMPPNGFSGTDTFQYAISDGNGGIDTATVTYYIYPPTETDCFNNTDDDGDGLIDCLDSDCLPKTATGFFKN